MVLAAASLRLRGSRSPPRGCSFSCTAPSRLASPPLWAPKYAKNRMRKGYTLIFRTESQLALGTKNQGPTPLCSKF